MPYIRRTGGLWFWRVGRFGGSLYRTRKSVRDEIIAERKITALLGATAFFIGFIIFY